jgi:hypothetical protein
MQQRKFRINECGEFEFRLIKLLNIHCVISVLRRISVRLMFAKQKKRFSCMNMELDHSDDGNWIRLFSE